MTDYIKQVCTVAKQLSHSGRLSQTKYHMQHGDVPVYKHCLAVAVCSLKLADFWKLDIDSDSLIRGALLHDYFLYDWHDSSVCLNWHGFVHPKKALANAQEDFDLNDLEKDIIVHHMFPLNLSPPRSKEAWLVCIADKLCAITETVKGRKRRQVSTHTPSVNA